MPFLGFSSPPMSTVLVVLHHWQADSVGHREGVRTHMERAEPKHSLHVIIFFVLAFDIQHSRSYSEKLPRIVRCYDEEDIEQKLIRSETTA